MESYFKDALLGVRTFKTSHLEMYKDPASTALYVVSPDIPSPSDVCYSWDTGIDF